MGSFWGHIIPAVFLIPYGLNWCILSMWYYLTSGPMMSKKPLSEFDGKSWLPLCCCPRYPIEPMIKIASAVLSLLIEIFVDSARFSDFKIDIHVYSVYNHHGEIRDQGKMQHITIYIAFLLSGIVDLLALCLTLPKQFSKLFLSLAFFIEGFILATHIGGKDSYNILAHSLLAIVSFMCVLFSLMRIKQSSNLVINLGFGNCLLLQGTWFLQMSHFLFTDFLAIRGGTNSSHTNNHYILQFMSNTFAWHVLVIAACNLILWAFLSLIARQSLLRRKTISPEEDMVEEKQSFLTA